MVASNSSKQIVKPIVLPSLHTLCGSGRPFIRVAAISGASALAVQWYFEYLQNKKKSKFDVEDIYSPDSFTNHSKELFLSVNVMHLMHSVALLSVPLCRSPFFVSIFVLIVEYIHWISINNIIISFQTGTMFLLGILMFSGSGYYRSFGGDKDVRVVQLSGSGCLCIAWASLLFWNGLNLCFFQYLLSIISDMLN